MLYKFKSKATGDLILLEPNGRRMLEIMGKAITPKGIVLPEEMGAAVSALRQAIEFDEAQQTLQTQEALGRGEPPPRMEAISLRQRATPLIEMLQRCQKADKEMVWGV